MLQSHRVQHHHIAVTEKGYRSRPNIEITQSDSQAEGARLICTPNPKGTALVIYRSSKQVTKGSAILFVQLFVGLFILILARPRVWKKA